MSTISGGRTTFTSGPAPVRRRGAGAIALVALGAGLVAACGGSSSGGTTTPPGGGGGGGGGTTTTLAGVVAKGPVSGSTVTAFALANGSKGSQLGTATTDGQGRFTMTVGTGSGPVLVEATGGSYTDEAAGTTMTMQAADTMSAVVPDLATEMPAAPVQVTPLTTMAQARAQAMSGGMTAQNAAAAEAAVGSYFSVADVLHTSPMDPLASGSGAGATQDARNYGMSIAAMSQYAHAIGMTSSSGMVTAMARDASDGVMNGMMGSTAISMAGMGGMMGGTMMQPTAGTSGLSTAMHDFVASAQNRSGVTLADMQALMDRLAASNGQLAGGAPATGSGVVAGTVFMGKMTGGTVTAYAAQGGMMSGVLAHAAPDASGNFQLQVGGYSGPMMLRYAGGTYADPATGTSQTMPASAVLTAAIPNMTASAQLTGVQITPLTSMAQTRAQAMPGGMSTANVTAANGAVGSHFETGDPTTTAPMDPTVAGAGAGASPGSRNHGMVIAAMSEYAKTSGTTTCAGVATALMTDATDGVLDGMMSGAPVMMMTGTSGMGGMMTGTSPMPTTLGTADLSTAMATFVGDTSVNRSGVTTADMQPLVNALASSNTLQ